MQVVLSVLKVNTDRGAEQHKSRHWEKQRKGGHREMTPMENS